MKVLKVTSVEQRQVRDVEESLDSGTGGCTFL